eukprot:7937175-Pyramimonas_sp.AAC.1
MSGTRRSLKVGISGLPDPNLFQAPSYLKSRGASAAFCYCLGGPEPNLPCPPPCFLFVPTSSDRRVMVPRARSS